MINTNIACKKMPSIILGRKVRKYYKIVPDEWLIKHGYPTEPKLQETTETIERIKIGEYDLPLLEEKDEIYLSDKNVYTTIQKVTVGTDGKMYYNVSYVVECINELEESKSKLQAELDRLKVLYEERINKIEKEKEIKNKELEELKAKVEERKKWQENNPDAIKGIIIYEIPKDKDAKPLISLKEWQEYIYNVILNTPKEYIIATSFDRVTYIDKTDKNLEVITK